MKKTIALVIAAVLVFLASGAGECARPTEIFKAFFAVSTAELEDLRKNALVKVFDEDYPSCYERIKGIIKKMPDTSIYAEKKGMIAVYCLSLNSTPVGIFFTEVEPSRTKVELSSASTPAKNWVASNVFSGKVQDPIVKFKID